MFVRHVPMRCWIVSSRDDYLVPSSAAKKQTARLARELDYDNLYCKSDRLVHLIVVMNEYCVSQ